jgi:hypothetical protein
MALLYHKPRYNTRSFLYTGRARAVTFLGDKKFRGSNFAKK